MNFIHMPCGTNSLALHSFVDGARGKPREPRLGTETDFISAYV